MNNIIYIGKMKEIQKGIYKHYKNGKTYQVIGIAYNADNNVAGDPLDFPYVLYKPTYNDSTWVRPLAQFIELLEYEGKKVRRFELMDSY